MDNTKKIDYTSESRVKAHKRYMEKFVEVKVRMTPDRRTCVQGHANDMSESVNSFINRAIDEAMERDSTKTE